MDPKLKLALVWPLDLTTHPVQVGGTAVGVFLITGQLPWEANLTQLVRGYGIGVALYFAILSVQAGEAEVSAAVGKLPPFVKKMLGF